MSEEEEEKEKSGEKQLLEERWRRVGVSELFKRKEMAQSNTFSPRWSRSTFRIPEGVMAVKVS